MGIVETVIGLLYYLALILGSLVILASIISLIITAFIAILLAYSFKTGNVLFPNLVISGMFFFESPVKTIFRTFGVNDSRIDRIAIGLKNKAICPTFRKIPYARRAIFVPQCVRSIRCPAALSPEGIMCKDCGACGIGAARKEAKKLGYQFFIVPGSSFILRLMRQYQPQAIIGVGCLCEVREGLDMMHRGKIPAMGVILDKSGCIATTLNWEKLYEIMNLHETQHGDIEVRKADE
jgi:hypothetical protein